MKSFQKRNLYIYIKFITEFFCYKFDQNSPLYFELNKHIFSDYRLGKLEFETKSIAENPQHLKKKMMVKSKQKIFLASVFMVTGDRKFSFS